MELHRTELARCVLLLLFTALVAAIVVSSVKYLPSTQPPQVSHPNLPKPPLLTAKSHFPRVESQFPSKARRRLVVLHGPEGEIETVNNPKCMPEHEAIFSTEEGRRVRPRTIDSRLRL